MRPTVTEFWNSEIMDLVLAMYDSILDVILQKSRTITARLPGAPGKMRFAFNGVRASVTYQEQQQ